MTCSALIAFAITSPATISEEESGSMYPVIYILHITFVIIVSYFSNRVYAQTRFCAFVRSSAESAFLTCALKRQILLRPQTTNMICSTCAPWSFAIINVSLDLIAFKGRIWTSYESVSIIDSMKVYSCQDSLWIFIV